MKIEITKEQYNKLLEGLGMSLAFNPKLIDEYGYDFYSSEEGFSKDLKRKEKYKKLKTSADSIGKYRKFYDSNAKISEKPYSPIQANDLPLDKYLELKNKK